MSATDQSIICLANDRVYDYLVALSESVRRHTELPLVIIPFDERTRRVRSFARRRGLEILDDPTLGDLDRLGSTIWPGRVTAPHMFRKLAAFWSRFDSFLLIDADVVLLSDPRRFLDAHRRDDPHGVWCFDTGEGQAYRPGPLRDRMVRSGFPGVNAGVLISGRGVITLEQTAQVVEAAMPVRDQFLEVADQPFVNFLLETERIPVSKVGDLFSDVAWTVWADANLSRRDGTWVVDEPSWPDHGRAPAMLHWSGSAPSPFMPHRRLFVEYRAGTGGTAARAFVNVRLGVLATARLPGKVRSVLVSVLRGRPLGAWR